MRLESTHIQRVLKGLSIVCLALVLSGCYGRIELNKLAISELMALDLTENGNILLSMQFVIPGKLGTAGGGGTGARGGGTPVYVMQATGKTLGEALDFMQAKVPRRLFTSHIRVLVLGEEFARAGVAPALETISRERELRLSMRVIVTKGRAVDLLQTDTHLNNLPAESLFGLVDQNITPTITVRELILNIVSDGADSVVPWIQLTGNVDVKSREQPPPQNLPVEYEVVGSGIFLGDALEGFVALPETRGYAWVVGKISKGTITSVWPPEWGEAKSSHQTPLETKLEQAQPPGPGDGGPGAGLRKPNQVSARLINSRAQMRPVGKGDLAMEIVVKADFEISDNSAGVDLSKPEMVKRVETLLNEDIERRIGDMLHLAQDVFHADIFGFGGVFHRAMPALWHTLRPDWHTVFSSLRVSAKVTAQVKRTGMNTAPAPYRESQMRQ